MDGGVILLVFHDLVLSGLVASAILLGLILHTRGVFGSHTLRVIGRLLGLHILLFVLLLVHRWLNYLDIVLLSEPLDFPFDELLHPLRHLVYLAACHVVALAVVPNELDVAKTLFVGVVPPLQELLFDSGEVHRGGHDLRIIKQTEFLPLHWLEEGLSILVLLDVLDELLHFGVVGLLKGERLLLLHFSRTICVYIDFKLFLLQTHFNHHPINSFLMTKHNLIY